MIKRRRMLSLILVAVMALSLMACGGSTGASTSAGAGDTASAETAAVAENGETPLVVGYSPFNSKFSPFFSETAYDQDVQALTQLPLLTSDRMGAIVYKGIEGETIPYNGTDYTYYGPADLEVTENADGTVFYDFTLRDDLVFSDGEPVTIDDVIFSMYVLCDPTYDGSATLFSQPIEGMEEYRSGMETLFNLIYTAGEGNTDFTYWTQEQQDKFWSELNAGKETFIKEICDYCIAAGLNADGDSVAACLANWGFTLDESATAAQAFDQMVADGYEGDVLAMVGAETAGSTIEDLMPSYQDYTIGVETGTSAPSITGIQKTGDNTLRIVATKVDATLIYQLTTAIAPLHYYGDKAQFDYDNNMFGFPKGDLSTVRAKTTQPMGAGPYKFVKFENGVVNFEANDKYYLGAPKTKYVNFREVQDQDKLNGVVTGTIDITDPSFHVDAAAAISKENGGELTGDKITTSTVDNLGYGYIGINSHNVCVGDDPASEESKNLRRAFATIFSVYRDVAIDSYYGEVASVINYPISNTSWAAPQPTGGKVTAAPEGAKMEYEVQIPADGSGDHPSFMILTLAKDALAELGINLIVTDLTNSSDLWTGLEAGQVEMWCAAWGATVDPDMYQIYYSDVANGGAQPGGSNYMYKIEDEELDSMILEARESTDQEYRKAMYKACLDTIIDWACEIPVYQRQNAIIFSTERVNIDTVTPDITTFYGWMQEIQNIEMR